MAARGPDFRTGFVYRDPVSNADVAQTVAQLLELDRRVSEVLGGDLLVESLVGGEYFEPPEVSDVRDFF
jgi:hypothetical protein